MYKKYQLKSFKDIIFKQIKYAPWSIIKC